MLAVLIHSMTVYAPVTISDNEAPESNGEDEGEKSGDMENGMQLGCARCTVTTYRNYAHAGTPSNPGRKHKRPAHPSMDAKLVIEAEYTAVNDTTPKIQNKTNQPDSRSTPPMQPDPLTTGPCHPPSSPHTVLWGDAGDKITKLDKPRSKLAVKALQNARVEVR